MDIERQDPWPWFGKLSEGDKVKVCSRSIYEKKNSVNGHICIIKKIGSFQDRLGKNYKNNGKFKSACGDFCIINPKKDAVLSKTVSQRNLANEIPNVVEKLRDW